MSNKNPDPWIILGIPRTATVEEIKAQYKKLALAHHPDKCDPSATPEERKKREERFKDISVAYQVATEYARSRENGAPDWDEYEDAERWKAMWERVEDIIRNRNIMSIFSNVVKDTFKDITNIAISRMASATAAHATASDHATTPAHESDISSDVDTHSETNNETNSETNSETESSELDPDPHIFKLMVSMEEVHLKKSRKVRLFLTEYPKEPFFVHVEFDQFPEMIYVHRRKNVSYKIIIQMKLKKHPIYHWDDLLNNWDLYTTVRISLYEYFTGTKRYVPALTNKSSDANADNDVLTIDIPSFHDVKKTILFEHMGLRKKGNLYVVVEIRLPTKDEIETNDLCKNEEDKNIFLNICQKLSKHSM